MPVAVNAPTVVIPPPQKLWTREECVDLARKGLIDYERFELIEGVLIRKVAKNTPHIRVLARLMRCLRSIFSDDLRVLQESPIDVGPEDNQTSQPEPDAVVLARSLDDLPGRPQPEDLLLVVEVSDTTLGFDLVTKAKLYARASIQDYWVVDIGGGRIIVHRDPSAGSYRSVAAYSVDERIAPLAAPHFEIRVGDLLSPAV